MDLDFSLCTSKAYKEYENDINAADRIILLGRKNDFVFAEFIFIKIFFIVLYQNENNFVLFCGTLH